MYLIPVLSRTGRTDPGGKLVEIPTVRVAQATLDGARQIAHREGVSFSELVRAVLEARVHGADHAAQIAAAHAHRIAGTTPGIDPSRLS